MGSPLNNRSFVFDPVSWALFVGLDRSQSETALVLFQHLLLVLIGSIGLLKNKTTKQKQGSQERQITSLTLLFTECSRLYPRSPRALNSTGQCYDCLNVIKKKTISFILTSGFNLRFFLVQISCMLLLSIRDAQTWWCNIKVVWYEADILLFYHDYFTCQFSLGSISQKIPGKWSSVAAHRKSKVNRQNFVSCLFDYLRLLEVITDFFHNWTIVSPLHNELFVLKAEAATAGLTLPIHCTVWEETMYVFTFINKENQFH